MKVLTAAQMQEIDRFTIEEIGLPGVVLMENAGRAVAREIIQKFSGADRFDALVVAGKGNNGGDGFVLARYLIDNGWHVETIVLAARDAISGDAAVYLSALENCGAQVRFAPQQADLQKCLKTLGPFDVLVDAIFGTGLTKPVQGLYKMAIDWLNQELSTVVAVDIPSGIDGTTGQVLGAAVKADLTITFEFPKIGNVSYPGAGHVGELVTVPIGIPRNAALEVDVSCLLIDSEEARRILPKRNADGHKGTFGHLLVLAGSMGKSGAAVMAAESGLRGGSGLVTLACPQSVQTIVASQLKEVMTSPLLEYEGEVSLQNLAELQKISEEKQGLALGPGLGTGDEVGTLIRRIVQDFSLPMVIDADGLNALSGHTHILRNRKTKDMVLTPHPGEMSRLAKVPVHEVQADRISVASQFAKNNGVVIVLKGAKTIIACPEGKVHINSTGHVGMASGGMGDVLTGIIGSFLAQGMSAMSAATLGVYLHGQAADRLLSTFGDAGLLATDVMNELPAARRALTGEI